jgi:hypothetical protein
MKLIPYQKYIVKGNEMHFWRLWPDGTPEFYYYAKYGGVKHTIYYHDTGMKLSDIIEIKEPMICMGQPKDQRTNVFAGR